MKDLILKIEKERSKDPLDGMVAVDYYDGENVFFYRPCSLKLQCMKMRIQEEI